ncbi:hypothetical protein [Ferruginibacter sp.]
MKKIHLILFFFTLILISCSKSNNDFTYSGTLTGPDLKMGPCAGGVYLQTGSKLYHVEELPGMSSQSFYNLNFPVTIYFNGSLANKCAGLADDGYFSVSAYKF